MTVETTSATNENIEQTGPGNVSFSAPSHLLHTTPAVDPAEKSLANSDNPSIGTSAAPQQTNVFPKILSPAPASGTGTWLQTPLILTPKHVLQSVQCSTGISALGISIGFPQGIPTSALSPSQMIYTRPNHSSQQTNDNTTTDYIDVAKTPQKKPRTE